MFIYIYILYYVLDCNAEHCRHHPASPNVCDKGKLKCFPSAMLCEMQCQAAAIPGAKCVGAILSDECCEKNQSLL